MLHDAGSKLKSKEYHYKAKKNQIHIISKVVNPAAEYPRRRGGYLYIRDSSSLQDAAGQRVKMEGETLQRNNSNS